MAVKYVKIIKCNKLREERLGYYNLTQQFQPISQSTFFCTSLYLVSSSIGMHCRIVRVVVFFCTYSDLFPWSDSSIQQTSDRLVLCCDQIMCGVQCNNRPSPQIPTRYILIDINKINQKEPKTTKNNCNTKFFCTKRGLKYLNVKIQ